MIVLGLFILAVSVFAIILGASNFREGLAAIMVTIYGVLGFIFGISIVVDTCYGEDDEKVKIETTIERKDSLKTFEEMVEPISYKDVVEAHKQQIPDEVITTINRLIKTNYNARLREAEVNCVDVGRCVGDEDVVDKIVNGIYDIESYYNQGGWDVSIRIPSINNGYADPTLYFSPL